MAQPKTPPIRLSGDTLAIYSAEAQPLGVSVPRLITTDLNRYRRMAVAAVPDMTERQWSLLSHVLDGAEFQRLVGSRHDDSLPTAGEIAAEIASWIEGHGGAGPAWATQLLGMVQTWSPLIIAGLLFRLRAEGARKVEAAQ